MAGVFRALSCVHEADVVCRACSLDAIMLDAKGYPQLVDLSLSKSVTNGRTHTLCGTRDYLAPEIVKMAGHGVEADYWALGALPFLSCSSHIPSCPLTPPYAPLHSPHPPLGVLMFELLAAYSPWEEAPRDGGAEAEPKNEMQADARTRAHTRYTRTCTRIHTHTRSRETRTSTRMHCMCMLHVCVQVYAAITAHGQDGAPPLRFPAGVTEAARSMINELMEPNLDDRLGCHPYMCICI